MAEKKHRKTPEQIALERLGVAERLVVKLTAKKTKAETDAAAAAEELAAAVKRRDFLQNDPALVVEAEVLDDDPEPAGLVCPECAAGKHQNCTKFVLNAEDEQVTCACAELNPEHSA